MIWADEISESTVLSKSFESVIFYCLDITILLLFVDEDPWHMPAMPTNVKSRKPFTIFMNGMLIAKFRKIKL